MKTRLSNLVAVSLATTTAGVLAGEITVTEYQTSGRSTASSGDWCESLQSFGKLYEDKSNPFVQEVKIFGRAHQQWGYTDGEYDGPNGDQSFSGHGDELRRLRFGTSIKFLNGFKVLGRVDLEKGGFRDTSLGYDGFDELYLQYTFNDITVGYGLYKLGFGGEEWLSSKKIKTIERSNMNNYFAGGRVTGGRVEFERNGIDFRFGVYNSDSDPETFGQWDGGVIYHMRAAMAAGEGELALQAIYNDADSSQDEVLGYEWAVNATYEATYGCFDLLASATYGENHSGDALYGIVLEPSTYLIEDTLEAVFRYQWFHSQDQNIRPQSRNVRNVVSRDGVSIPGGDDNHTFYAGLNYFICDHNLKLMTGVEYETLDSDRGDTDATTLWGAVRFYF